MEKLVRLLQFAFILLVYSYNHYGINCDELLEMIRFVEAFKGRDFNCLVNQLQSSVVKLKKFSLKVERNNWIDFYQYDLLMWRHQVLPLFRQRNGRSALIAVLCRLKRLVISNSDIDTKDELQRRIKKNHSSLQFISMEHHFIEYSTIYNHHQSMSFKEFINLITFHSFNVQESTRSLIIKFINIIESSLDMFFKLSNYLEHDLKLKDCINCLTDFDDNGYSLYQAMVKLTGFIEIISDYPELKRHHDDDLMMMMISDNCKELTRNLYNVHQLLRQIIINNNTKTMYIFNKRLLLLSESFQLSTTSYTSTIDQYISDQV